MKKQIKLNKITPEVRRMIHELTMTLPNVPFFIMGKTGMVPQRIAVGKRVSGQQLKEEGGKVSGGGEIDVKVAYVQRGTKTRMMNHKVTLTDQYQKKGQDGINEYVAYVKQMSVMIEEMQKGKPAGVKPAAPKEKTIPTPEDFGFKSGEWTVDGGEQAYNKALAEYDEQPMPVATEEAGPFPEMNESK
jgi:hypothetical protein